MTDTNSANSANDNKDVKPRESHNVDDVLVSIMQGTQQSTVKSNQQTEQIEEKHQEKAEQENSQKDLTTQQKEPEDTNQVSLSQDTKTEEAQKKQDSKTKTADTNNAPDDSPIDEYGNPIAKARLYTEEELNQRIRERLSRGRYAQDQQPQQYQQQQDNFTSQQVNQAKADGFQHDPDSEETWDVQLRKFMNQVLDEREAQHAERQWRQQEETKQLEFQDKFSSGMSKYNDFHEVVSGKPITDSMMLATRNLENPAAFVYGASKMHPQELDRISRIPDPYMQAAEIGRLHERMVKERKSVTNAPKPIQAPRGDVPSRVTGSQPSIDQRIDAYGRQRSKR